MNASKLKSLIALVAVSLCVGVWYKRLSDTDAFPSTHPAAIVPTATSTPVLATIGGIAPVLATINWADPQDPAAIPLDSRGDRFLFDTTEGLQVWDSNTFKMSPLVTDARLMENIWMRMRKGVDHGTLFAVTSGRSAKAATLFWVGDDQTKITLRFDLPHDFVPSALVRLSQVNALVCSATTRRALVVGMIDGDLQRTAVASSPSLIRLLQDVGVVGPVEDFGNLTERDIEGTSTYQRPMIFDTRTCSWIARKLPEPLASGENLEILPITITSFRNSPSIVAASWIDPATREPRTLNAPLVWDREDQQWRERQRSVSPIITPNRLRGVAEGEGTYAADVSQGRFAFLAPVDERWRESTQRLPVAEGVKLLRIGREGVLALLIDSRQPGRVVRLDPSKESWLDVRLPNYFSYGASSAVSLKGGEVMIVHGGKTTYATLVRPKTPNIASLPNLPQPQLRPSGVELADGSVVIFGGLHADCYASDLRNCAHGTLPSFRWISSEQRWQPLPELAVPFAFGMALDGGNSEITSAYRRSDFLVQSGNELFYLSTAEMKRSYDRVEPTRLYRWRLGSATQSLSATRLSRSDATLIELNDGRIAVMGGAAAKEPPSPACQACQSKRQLEVARLARAIARKGGAAADIDTEEETNPEEMVPQCDACATLPWGDYFSSARSCEIYDLRAERWYFGPYTNYAGGRAVKLANGRIFKLGLLGYNATDALYAAETADAGLTQWTAAPPFPFKNPAAVSSIHAIGNQVLVIMVKPADHYVVWDDASRQWGVRPLPVNSDWSLRNIPLHVSQSENGKVLLIYNGSYEYLAWPPQ